MREVRALQASVGADAADLALKVAAKRRLDAALAAAASAGARVVRRGDAGDRANG